MNVDLWIVFFNPDYTRTSYTHMHVCATPMYTHTHSLSSHYIKMHVVLVILVFGKIYVVQMYYQWNTCHIAKKVDQVFCRE
jgi:hypothetical protein